jgi:hypothetical protein
MSRPLVRGTARGRRTPPTHPTHQRPPQRGHKGMEEHLNESRADAVKCKVYANGILVGAAELSAGDPPMGVAFGAFLPDGAYKEIQPIVRENSIGLPAVADTQERIERQAKYDALRLSVITEDGEVLEAVGIGIIDFSEELDTDPYLLEVVGIPSEVYRRLFPIGWQQYWSA